MKTDTIQKVVDDMSSLMKNLCTPFAPLRGALLVLLTLSGCSFSPTPAAPPAPILTYHCVFFNMHGVYANAEIFSSSLVGAIREAERVRDKLVREQVLPQCGVSCKLKDSK